jgi:hypothetical protein
VIAWFRTPDAKFRALMKRLHRDQSGNIIVLYVAASLLLVGMLWAIIGTGARMVQKETIQSSADAAAFSAAVIKAKGLNIIAFCNLVMALLLAIIMLLRLIKGALLILLGVCLAACLDIFGGEVLCAFAPTVETIYNEYSQLESQLEPRLTDAMKGLAKLERAVNKTFPALALVEAYRVGTHSSYQRNFGKGSLVTIAWPLPVGKDLSLPTKDGTWSELCDQATNSIDRLIEIALSKIGLGPVAGLFGGAVKSLLSPLEGILCGSGGGGSSPTVTTREKITTCDASCNGAEGSVWSGKQVLRNPDGTFAPGWPTADCKLDGFDQNMCGGTGQKIIICNDGKEYKFLNFEYCIKKKDASSDLGSSMNDKPIPLDLADDFASRKNTRAFTLLTDTNMDQRRQSVGVATKNKSSNPMLNQLLGTAQSELFAFNGTGHDDLWHMDWKARLVRFSFGDQSETSTGDASSQGVPSAGASTIADAVKGFISNNGAAAFQDQFMLH